MTTPHAAPDAAPDAAPTTLAPTAATTAADADAVVAIEHAIWDAVARDDWDAAHGYLDGITFMMNGAPITWTREVTEARRAMGLVVRRHAIDDLRTRPVGRDAMLVTYRLTLDVADGGAGGMPPLHYLSVFERDGATWKLVATAVAPETGVAPT